MISTAEIQNLLANGGTVNSDDGDKIGKIGQVYLDDRTGDPEWVTVKTGMFGSAESFVPLRQARVQGDEIRVPYDKDKVKDAPRVDDAEGHLSEAEEAELYRYYELDYADAAAAGVPGGVAGGAPRAGDDRRDRTDQRGGPGHDTSGPTTDDAMTRSEEQLHVGKEQRESGRARLRKYVVTENVTQTVPVSREEVRVEREPITDANRGDAKAGPELSDEEHEVTLHEERAVVDKETVPVERVRMDTETVTENQQVNEQVSKEKIETETEGGRGDKNKNRR